MHVATLNWMQVEQYLARDDRAVLPIGCTEQHAFLSLATDSILAERVAVEAAEPLSVPVFPVIAYGITPRFRAYPGTVSLRVETLLAVVRDALDSLAGSGFKRVLVVNGHGGNQPIASGIAEWMGERPGVTVKLHNWWNAPKVWQKVQEIDPVASHASWMENFPWTRLAGAKSPDAQKPMVDLAKLGALDPAATRAYLGDGNFGGRYQRPDDDVFALWRVAVEETRELIAGGW
ncbi:MAG TPA: creatininase family protein [Candidatus Saccharimonadaceae bacterium]|jgi:creatinine amidohydrolase|nr:creatininase family protein [Candidatus Saccharimonadaceae bacterium]